MVYSLNYRRPSHVASTSSNVSLSGDEKQASIHESIQSGSSTLTGGIPPALSFDRIIAGGTCPPVTVREFMNYLKYIEHSAENLQFFLWHRDYTARWERLQESEKLLSPKWEPKPEDGHLGVSPARPKRVAPQIMEVLKNTDFAEQPKSATSDQFYLHTPSRYGSAEDNRDMNSEYGSSFGDEKTLLSSSASGQRMAADQAFDDAGMKWKPFTAQPFRSEITRIISIYFAENAPRELNLSSRERQSVLHALQHTTHPSAFRTVLTTVEWSLRRQAHPNFIRWTICNGNPARVTFARALGAGGIVIGLVSSLLLTLSSAGRAWRILPFLAWFIGIATLIAAWKGMCIVLHGLHHRHLRPWELFTDAAEESQLEEKTSSTMSLTSNERNSFEHEPWVPKYKQRNMARKIFDREIWIQEPALRGIQDTIALQAVIAAAVGGAVMVGVFCAVPKGSFF
ncbi:unnamed protein product [Zymoseptoria tritici ST99CH_1E4]|uniref:RGS domain-containing protein n=1 Tax=Zymoseptoria tritici ST99CH_1E4 TaxID=1276532 RepID=A0A2H1GFU3_ZYMTR|nr:unnamed protein product [Zymoseptoria tritici ST99CH_1E4]